MIRKSVQKYFITTVDPEGHTHFLLRDLNLIEYKEVTTEILIANTFSLREIDKRITGKCIFDKLEGKKFGYVESVTYDFHDHAIPSVRAFVPEFKINPIEITVEYFE